jgi:hypothetical protein
MNTYGGVDVQIYVFLALVDGEWSASRPSRITPAENRPDTHWRQGWVGPRAGMDGTDKWKFLTLPGFMGVRGSVVVKALSRARPVRKADNLTAICEPIV